jgi:hypothetical protein
MNSLTTMSKSLTVYEMLLNALGLSGSDDRNKAMLTVCGDEVEMR